MESVHPFIVHFPIALLTVSLVLDMMGGRDAGLRHGGWWLMIFGTCTLLLAIGTGLQAESSITIGDTARPVFEMHEQIAFAVATIFGILVLWRASSRGSIPRQNAWLYWLLMTAGVGLLWVGAWYGGMLVYRFGIGVSVQ
jgi:uncharacterized membrane protein